MKKHISNYLSELLEAHGLVSSSHNDWVTVRGEFPAFRAFYDPPQTEKSSGALSIQIMLDESSLIEECFAAFGDTHIEAINGALEQFTICMFHPIIAAYYNHVGKEQVNKEVWKLNTFSKVDVWSGNIALRFSSDVCIETPVDWLDTISKELKNTKVKKGYNWITSYCSRLNSDSLIASANLNNSGWPAGLEATTRLEWPEIEGFYGARLFILLKR